MAKTPAQSMFTKILTDASGGLVLKPLLHSYLFEAEWPEDFSVRFKKGTSRRAPDGWFHPSEHPNWPARMLWWYLTRPEEMVPEQLEYMNTMSVTIGTAMHHFVETCLTHLGVLCGPDKLRSLGFEVNPENGEPSIRDEACRSKGHMDGVLELLIPSRPELPYHLFEFKTSNQMTLAKIKDLDLDAFIEKWPQYYAQAQEYLRMTGYGISVVLFMQMGYPWEMREFHIPANPQFQYDTSEKYRLVVESAKTGIMPTPCCGPRSKESRACPARAVCPVAFS